MSMLISGTAAKGGNQRTKGKNVCVFLNLHILNIYRIMHELSWITTFGWRVMRFANDCHKWRSHESKSLTNRITSDPKIVIHSNKCIILFLACHFMSWTHNSTQNNYWLLILPLSLRTVFSDLVLQRPQLICDVTRMWGTLKFNLYGLCPWCMHITWWYQQLCYSL